MSVKENLEHIKTSLPPSCTLIAVSKKQPEQRIEEALKAGHRVFGENRVQEAQEHWSNKHAQYPDLQLHLIGPLQTNKVKDAVALFDVIQTLDREKLARKLAEEMQNQNRNLECFIQVNTGDETQKSGIPLNELDNFIESCKTKYGLSVTGLMCIPPLDEPPALHFALLKKLARRHNLKNLSMGMSGDYEKAIALGATHIRIGTGVFGERKD